MCLPNNVYLLIDYRSSQRVTHNFTKETTRINCAKLGYIYFCYKSTFKKLFSFVKMLTRDKMWFMVIIKKTVLHAFFTSERVRM